MLARECARSHAGAWELVREPAYPGSVFAAVHDAEAFVERVDTPAFAALGIYLITSQSTLGTPEPRFLSQREADFVRRIGDARHVIRMSVGDVVEGRLVVHEGALVDARGWSPMWTGTVAAHGCRRLTRCCAMRPAAACARGPEVVSRARRFGSCAESRASDWIPRMEPRAPGGGRMRLHVLSSNISCMVGAVPGVGPERA